jgi:hypothetical protein
MKVFPQSNKKDNNPDYIHDRASLNTLFETARKKKPKYFNKLANDLKNKGKVNKIFDYAEKYISGKCTVEEVKIAFTKRRNIRPNKHRMPLGRIVKKR